MSSISTEIDMNLWLWILVAFVSLMLLLNRRKLFKYLFVRFAPRELIERWDALALHEDVEGFAVKTANAVVELVLARVTSETEAHFQDTLVKLRGQVLSLRKQIAELRSGWVTFGVHMRGFKLSEDDKVEYYALIQIQPSTGATRAHPSSAMRLIYPSLPKQYFLPNVGDAGFTSLGAPWYARVQGEPSVSMLGELYRVKGR